MFCCCVCALAYIYVCQLVFLKQIATQLRTTAGHKVIKHSAHTRKELDPGLAPKPWRRCQISIEEWQSRRHSRICNGAVDCVARRTREPVPTIWRLSTLCAWLCVWLVPEKPKRYSDAGAHLRLGPGLRPLNWDSLVGRMEFHQVVINPAVKRLNDTATQRQKGSKQGTISICFRD